MTAVGIIAEYNPFHSGHEFLLNQARLVAQGDPIIVLMSGNYVQRGAMAVMSKWARAQAALRSGADLVFEFPFANCVQPADRFAAAGVKILAGLGAQALFFGTENANLNFNSIAQKIVAIPKQSLNFKDYTQTYSTQYNQVLARELGYEVNQPNEILGIAYAVANVKNKLGLSLYPVQRVGSDHNALVARTNAVASASAIRQQLHTEPDWGRMRAWLPKAEWLALKQQGHYPSWTELFPFLKYRLESAQLPELHAIYQISEGLDHKFKAEIHEAQTFSEFLQRVKSKRYTYSRLRRLSLYALLNVTTQEMLAAAQKPQVELLGFSQRGREHLKVLRKKGTVPIVSKVDKQTAKAPSLALQVRVDRLFEQLNGQDQNFGRRPYEVE